MTEILKNLPVLPLVFMGLVVLASLFWASRVRSLEPKRLALLALTLSSVAGVFALALLRFRPGINLTGMFAWQPDGALRFVSDFGTSEEIWLNIALFVPASFFLTLFIRRPVVVILAGLVISFLAETIQGAFSTGVPDLSDVLSNTLGTVLGAFAGSVVLLIMQWPSKRRLMVPAIGIGVIVVASTLAVVPAASWYQSAYVNSVRSKLSAISFEQMKGLQTSSGSKILYIWRAGFNYADGNIWSSSSVNTRWPSSFLYVSQCVVATWRPIGLDVSGESGRVCKEKWV